MEIRNKEIVVEGRIIRTVRLEQEWYEDLEDPESMLQALKQSSVPAHLFTFWQRLPDIVPKYAYYMERDSIAALPVTTYKHWWDKQISAKERNMVRKAEKKGVVVRLTSFDDAFVAGMVNIFNETPIRQGKPFWHYGKDFDTIKKDFSRYIFREDMIGAYYNDELIGFIMLGYAGRFAITGQIISALKHRDKAPTNALLAHAVQLCETKRIPYLTYAKWDEGSLGDFKRHNGFQRFDMPRYYIPLTTLGQVLLRVKLHRGITETLSPQTKMRLKQLRTNIFPRKIT